MSARRTRLPGGGTDITFVLRGRGAAGGALELHGERVPGLQPESEAVIKGQPNLDRAGAEDINGPGTEEHTTGYVVVTLYSLEQLAAAGNYIRRGDKITAIGGRARNLFVTNNPIGEALSFGHFPNSPGDYVQINIAGRDPASVAEPTQGDG